MVGGNRTPIKVSLIQKGINVERVNKEHNSTSSQIKRKCEGKSESSPQKVPKTAFQSSEIFQMQAGCSTNSEIFEHHNEDRNKGQIKVVDEEKIFQPVLKTCLIPEGTGISPAYSDSTAIPEPIHSTSNITSVGRTHVVVIKSHENCTGKDKDCKLPIDLMTYQIERLQASELKLIKNNKKMITKYNQLVNSISQLKKENNEASRNYEKLKTSAQRTEAILHAATEKNKFLFTEKMKVLEDNEVLSKKNEELNVLLADKEKKIQELQDHLRNCVAKTTYEVKSQVFEKLEKDLSCIICTDFFNKPVILECSHTFCAKCISKWSREKQFCPLCRNSLTYFAENLALGGVIQKAFTNFSPWGKERAAQIIEKAEHLKTDGCLFLIFIWSIQIKNLHFKYVTNPFFSNCNLFAFIYIMFFPIMHSSIKLF